MRPLVLLVIWSLCCLAFAGCVTSPSIIVSVVDRHGTPQPYAQLTVDWAHRARSTEERVIIMRDGTDEHGRFTFHDTEVPDSIAAWSPDTRLSGTIYRVKWGYNVIVVR
jgi:hypothetical protein